MGLELLEYLGISIASATILIVVAKFILQKLIRREPDYYDKRELAEEAIVLANYKEAGEHGHEEKPAKKKSTKTTEKKTEKKPAKKKSSKPATKKPRKPSMNMKKDELIAAAKERGIELPEKITKAQILELIQEAEK